MKRPRYIFLDNWVLSDYTHEEKAEKLSRFLRSNSLTIVNTPVSMRELFNPNGRPGDRVSRATSFLASERCVVVSPETVFREELKSYPIPLADLPLELNLVDVPKIHRSKVLEMLLRRDELFLSQGRDMAEWAARYEESKANWLRDVEMIIHHAFENGSLSRGPNGKLVNLEAAKENFLITLDRRHFGLLSPLEREALGPNIVPLFLGGTKNLPAIRLSSLCFWHAYVNVDKSNLMKRRGSDIGDFYQISLVPYCDVFTADTSMCRLLLKMQPEVQYSCRVLGVRELNEELGISS